MKQKHQIWRYFAVLAVLIAAQLVVRAGAVSEPKAIAAQTAIAGDVIADWHQEAARLTVLGSSGLAPVAQGRAMAIVQVSVHDAVNGITGEFETYLSRLSAPAGASPEAAAIAASYHALRTLFPGQSMSLDSRFLTSLAANGFSVNDPGVEYGITAATRILAARANDGATQAQYLFLPNNAGVPGIWVPLPGQTALLPGWGALTPWVLQSGDQFRPDAPPALDSEQYARDYNEIKEIGAMNSTTRTGQQTQIAAFWLASPVAIWSQVLTQLNAARNFSLSQRARTFALTYLTASDSGVACWDAKYFYNFWRPQSAIRRGAEDDNDATIADPMWTPLFGTPRHPEYPSGHTSNSTAIVTIFQLVYGDDPGMSVTSTTTPPSPSPQTPITRQWNTLSEGLDEVIEARIYSGIHFRTADEVGSRLGRQVARFAWTHALRPCRGRGSRCS